MRDKAAVVVLNWNGIDYIRMCLEAVFVQSYESMRVIVVDNHSTDGSLEVIRDDFPEAELVELPDNLGFAKGTNTGVRRALAEPLIRWIATLNNDTRVDPEWLAEMVRTCEADPRVGMVASKILFMDRPRVLNSTGILIARDGSARDRGWLETDEGQYDDKLDVFGPSAGAALYRREMLEDIGLFDEDFWGYLEDLDLAWRGRLAGWVGRFAPRSIVHHKYSASTGFHSTLKIRVSERNRIWTLVRNYPARDLIVAIPWNAGRLALSSVRRILGLGPRTAVGDRPAFRETARAIAQARLEAYRGLPRAFEKRRITQASACVDRRAVETWFRLFAVPLAELTRT